MIPFPTPPTDSLYKFIAITGLLMAGAGTIVPFFVDQQMIERLEKDRLAGQERMRSAIFQITAIAQKDQLTDEQRQAQLASIGKSIEGLHEKEMQAMNDNAHELIAFARKQKTWLDRCLWAGVLVASVGFSLWWIQVQRWQDKKLKIEYETARIGLEDAKKNGSPTRKGK